MARFHIELGFERHDLVDEDGNWIMTSQQEAWKHVELIEAAPALLAMLKRLLHETSDGQQPCGREIAIAAKVIITQAEGAL